MFLRMNKRNKDGKEHRYWNIVENHRVGKSRVVQKQVLYLEVLAKPLGARTSCPQILEKCVRNARDPCKAGGFAKTPLARLTTVNKRPGGERLTYLKMDARRREASRYFPRTGKFNLRITKSFTYM